MDKKPIRSFRDLIVYQESRQLCIVIFKKILPCLPNIEKYDLYQQISRSSKAIPRLISEGFAKKHQRRGFQKYVDDALAESNETIVSIEQCKELYNIEPQLCESLIKGYDKCSRQLYTLARAWDKINETRTKNKPLTSR